MKQISIFEPFAIKHDEFQIYLKAGDYGVFVC